jgi:hypothetical protein
MSASCPQINSQNTGRRPFKRPGRTREAQQAKQFRAQLIAHLGGRPSTTQAALIEQAVQLRLRLSTMDRRYAETRTFTEHDSRVYLAHANSYSRLLRQLGLQATPERPIPLAQRLAALTRQPAQAATEAAA